VTRFARIVLCAIVLASLAAQSPAEATTATVVRITHTSKWKVPSPDPSGITYYPKIHRLLISDSGVDNTHVWHHRNLFYVGLKGRLRSTGSLTKATFNPVGIAWNWKARCLYVVDDNADAVYRFGRGRDGRLGTKDDPAKRIIYTEHFGFTQPHGVAWRPKKDTLIIVDSALRRVYKFHRGKDRRFGTKDDIVSSFGVGKYGLTHPEGIAYDGVTDHLFIVSDSQNFILVTTMKGRLVKKIDLTATGINRPSALTFAPGSGGQRHHLYVTDRGVNYTVDPNENDGRLFELRLG